MPLRLVTGTVAQLAADATGWVAADALAVDGEGRWTLDPGEPVNGAPHPANPVRVTRVGDGYHVRSDIPAEAWAPVVSTPAGAGRAARADGGAWRRASSPAGGRVSHLGTTASPSASRASMKSRSEQRLR